MHELAITEGIIEMAVPKALAAGAKKILAINFKIGQMSGVFPDAIRDCFEIAAMGTIAEGAELRFETVPVRIHCSQCGYEGLMNSDKKNNPDIEESFGSFVCPECSSPAFTIVSGRDYMVESLEVE